MAFIILVHFVLYTVNKGVQSANQLTYVVPVRSTHLEKSVPFWRLVVQVSVANDIGKGKAALPDISAPAYVKF
jgi:hypothetical protein